MNRLSPAAIILSAAFIAASALSRPAKADSLLFWSEGATESQIQSWKDRANGIGDWTLVVSDANDPATRRSIDSGRLPKALLHPKDIADLTLLSEAKGTDWALLPGAKATLVSAQSLQAAYLPLSEDAKSDQEALANALRTMKAGEPKAGQLEALASRWIGYGQPDFAIGLLDQAQAIEAGRCRTMTLLIDAQRLKRNSKEARRLMKIALRRYPDDPSLLRAAGELEMADGTLVKALDDYDKALSQGAAPSLIHRLKGEAYQTVGRDHFAIDEYRLALDQPGVPARLARLSAQAGNWSDASLFAARALDEDPSDWKSRLLLSKSLSMNGKYADAVKDRAKNLTAISQDLTAQTIPLSEIRSAVRDQLSDTINATRLYQTHQQEKSTLYASLLESIIASDHLRASLQGRTDWDGEDRSDKRFYLSLTLWSQGAYDLMKALESDSADEVSDAGETLLDALRQIDAVKAKSEPLPLSPVAEK